MFNPTRLVIDAFVTILKDNYDRTFGLQQPEYPRILAYITQVALENIANSDAPYHDMHHTMLVTEVGQEILMARQLARGGITPAIWMEYTIATLCHDIGYVRGVCPGDEAGQYLINAQGESVALAPGCTDAALTPWHVDRSKLFVRKRFGHLEFLDVERIEECLERTRFPKPLLEGSPDDLGGLVRAADLIGQMADVNYLRKTAALFCEFQETGTNQALGYQNPEDLRQGYPAFFWKVVEPDIKPALRLLSVTQTGRQWLNNLYANVFIQEHSGCTVRFGQETPGCNGSRKPSAG
ncbi:MAG: hypothetical protein H7831_05175 [Magnetococcus sp. WYHC-3]